MDDYEEFQKEMQRPMQMVAIAILCVMLIGVATVLYAGWMLLR